MLLLSVCRKIFTYGRFISTNRYVSDVQKIGIFKFYWGVYSGFCSQKFTQLIHQSITYISKHSLKQRKTVFCVKRLYRPPAQVLRVRNELALRHAVANNTS